MHNVEIKQQNNNSPSILKIKKKSIKERSNHGPQIIIKNKEEITTAFNRYYRKIWKRRRRREEKRFSPLHSLSFIK